MQRCSRACSGWGHPTGLSILDGSPGKGRPHDSSFTSATPTVTCSVLGLILLAGSDPQVVMVENAAPGVGAPTEPSA